MTPGERRRRFVAAIRAQLRRRGLTLSRGVARVLGTLAELEAELGRTLEGQPSAFDAERIPEVLRELERQTVIWSRRAVEQSDAAMEAMWQAGLDLVGQPLAAAEIQIGLPLLSTELLDEVSRYTADKIKGLGPRAISRIDDTLARMTLGGMTPYEAMLAVAKDLGEDELRFVGFRSESVIRTEGGRLYSGAGFRRQQHAAKIVTGLKKQWIWSGKSRATHSAVNGQIRDVNEPFDVGGERMMHPHDSSASAENVINCGCTSVPYKADW